MRARLPFLVGLLTASLLATISCSTKDSSGNVASPPATLDQDAGNTTAGQHSARYLWAYFNVYVDLKQKRVDVAPARNVADHWNTLGWLETWPCTNCVSIDGVSDSGHGTKLFDVRITHPFPNLNFTGFDVRGIAMFDGGFSFPWAGHTAPDRYAGEGQVVNADGYTQLYNSTTEGSGPGGLQGYIKGRFATPAAPSATLNGFKCYSTDDPGNTRNAFYAGHSIVRTYDIDMPDSSFVFGYAVDASWVPPTGKPVDDPMTDFPPEANCVEPWKIEWTLEPIGLGLTEAGGYAMLTLDVYDHQGKTNYSRPRLQIPDLYTSTFDAIWQEDFTGCSRWQSLLHNAGTAPAGNYKCLIDVEDHDNGLSPAWMEYVGYQVVDLVVSPYESSGWAKTWGGAGWDGGGYAVAVDDFGYAYVVGEFQGTVDFDPGDGVFEVDSNGGRDAYLAKYDANGDLVWVRTWGGAGLDWARGVTLDSSGNIYVTGGFSDTVDFDPGPGVEEDTSSGASDAFTSLFDSDGTFWWVFSFGSAAGDWGADVVMYEPDAIFVAGTRDDRYINVHRIHRGGALAWSRTWGGAGYDFGRGVAVDDDGSVYVIGDFEETVDFDTGGGVEMHTSNGSADVFLSKHDIDGNFVWAKTWGGTGLDGGEDIAVYSSFDVFVVGRFCETVDFDPDPILQYERTSNGWEDAFMSKFDVHGLFYNGLTWGGPGGLNELDRANGITIRGQDLYITGQFGSTVDFDPGAGTTQLTAVGGVDVYVSRFSTNGSFQWVRGWGGSSEDVGLDVGINSYGDLFVTGSFYGTVDFDPSAGIDEHSSNGERDVFLSKFTPDGEW